jgi:group I intron endonuclease
MADESLIQSGIYCIRNLVSGQIYIGSAVNIARRWQKHKQCLRRGRHHSFRLQHSWNEHGETAFLFEILELVYNNPDLLKREQRWMDHLNSACHNHGFNIVSIAKRKIFSDETKAKISAAKKGKGKKLGPQTPEHRANMSRSISKLIISPDARAKQVSHLRNMAASQKGVKISPEIRAKMSAAQYKRWNLARMVLPDQGPA